MDPPTLCHLCRCHRGQAGEICSAGFFDFALCGSIATESRGAHTRILSIFCGARREDSPAQRKTPSKRALKRRSSCPGPVGVEARQSMGGGGHCGTGEIPSCHPCPRPILRRSALATRILQLLSNESTAGRIHLGPGATEHEGQAHLAGRCLRQQRGMLAGMLAAAHACRQLRRPSMGR